MKRRNRIVSILLVAVMLLASLSVFAVGAANSDDLKNFNFENLGWRKDKDINPENSLTKYDDFTYTLATDFGAAGNQSIKFNTGNESLWNGIEIVPAEKMAGVTKYAFSVKLGYTNAIRLTFRHNSATP